MTSAKTILVIGTYDTKAAELAYLEQVIRDMGAEPMSMDISILGSSDHPVDISKYRVAAAATTTIPAIVALGEESLAMDWMARGARHLAEELVAKERVHGVISLGGTMGTDLALDVCKALPLGFPKYVVSTVAFSAVIPPDRLAADIQMILWAGGLYGLNDLCRATLAQAGGAVVGAAMCARPVRPDRSLIGMTSLGNTALTYMRKINPALEARGYDVAVFHSTGMGGRALETLAERGMFSAVLDLCLQEFSNGLFGSVVSSGEDRLCAAGRAGVPLIVAPGAADLVDWPTWQSLPEPWRDRPVHKHNKLISSLTLSRGEREHVAREMARCLRSATGPVHVLMPLHGVEGWDREGEIAHAPEDLAAYYTTLRQELDGAVPYTALDCHINDDAFVDAVLNVFDDWCARGVIAPAMGGDLRELA
jgi:uncharacterized protein (UPF0261 family)